MKTRNLIGISLFCALTAAGGMIKLPGPLVPVTLQTLFVYLSGSLLGARYGAYSQCLFLGLGLIGLPIFAMGGGFSYVLQPTFGYLASFPAAAWIIGKLGQDSAEDMNWKTGWLPYVSGMLIIFGVGVLYLFFNMNWIIHQKITFSHALWSGMILFLPGELIKMSLAFVLVKRLKPLNLNISDP
ncbi:hypothetical protein BVY01_00980 [bacterium I07]|nr:hypothetical protein BVY01_00980 [bacterium I07]